MVLVDSDVLIDALRGYPPALTWLASLGADPVVVPGIVAMEVVAGCPDKHALQRTEAELALHRIVWPTEADCTAAYGLLRTLRLPHGIGLLDCLIAQTALGLGVSLHTFNTRHFSVVPGLTTVQPYPKGSP
jgi:predicted nucleic acid-binding protein